MIQKKKEFGLVNLIIVIIATALITSLTTGLIIYNNERQSSEHKLSQDEALQEFITVYSAVLDDYYEDVDKQKMIDKAIEAMLNYLGDDYTTYLNKQQTEELSEKLLGRYEGIGVKVTEGNKILEVFDDSPAQASGLQAGDIIIRIDDQDVTTFTTNEIANAIKNNENKKVQITVQRNGEELVFEVERQELNIPAIESNIFEENGKKIGYLAITSFSNTVYDQFEKELKNLENQNIDSLIVDVRDNSGGYLKAATDIASLFLEKGKIIYSLESKNSKEKFKDQTAEHKEYKVVVLINENSASASEILAAALKESYNATLVGKTSYGKGKVQQTASLSGGSMYKYTSAKWLTPNGTCIDGVGLTPDYEVDLQLAEDGISIIDTQLNQAIEILK